MSTALIATVFNEAGSLDRWLGALAAQTLSPDEFVIVDGGSTDDTVQRLESFRWPVGFPRPKILVRRCNIAEGRNLAVRESTASIIVATDAGSVAARDWFEKMVAPFLADDSISVVGGQSAYMLRNEFQKRLTRYLGDAIPVTSENVMPSSRCVAFQRSAWAAVGGYPEWLTLTAEDSLFNHNLRAAGLRFHYAPEAIVHWEVRPDLRGYLRMIYGYGYGAAEAGLATSLYWRWLLSSLIPPLILCSRHPVRDIPLRYLRNLAAAAGWVSGLMFGHKAPAGWKKEDAYYLSPETQDYAATKPPASSRMN